MKRILSSTFFRSAGPFVAALAVLVATAPSGCATSARSDSSGNGSLINTGVDGGTGSGVFGSGGAGSTPAGSILATVRDFRFYDAADKTTDLDFENPPASASPWDDRGIVADTLGSDGKPVYKNAGGQTLTTHGQAQFDPWYHDVPGTNIKVPFELPLVHNPDGSIGFDSVKQGVPYGPGVPDQGNGFFPIDDGSPFATAFGNQGRSHNYSFTVEIHTVFQYVGGENFQFRGDDDVFVFIDGKLVIDLGGIHAPESASVAVDALGLTKGKTYALDFFSAERHVTGSNIEFTTTLALTAPAH